MEFGAPTPGFFSRTDDAGWEHFSNFPTLPNIDWQDPNMRFVDLTGDGHADVLVTEDQAFSTWHESSAEEGFGPAIHISHPFDEQDGPRLVFADGTQSIYLADMSGDGLSDMVRIRVSEVCYWPNIGYGNFGAKVTLDNLPWFDDPVSFDQRRVHLSDTDGSGPTDIIYLGRDGIRVYLNQHGNSLSDARLLSRAPRTDALTSVSVVDFLGRGTACLLWSSPLASDAPRPLRYLDLMGGVKPHLLTLVRNNLGAETRVEYASSTHFYLEDKQAGTPWITRLPFPVHVVTGVETNDLISGNRFVTRYTYHRGYFDGIEREFRGFGRVDQLDTEEFGVLAQSDGIAPATNLPSASIQVTGILTDAEKAQAKTLSTDPGWAKAVDRVGKQARQFFNDTLGFWFTGSQVTKQEEVRGDNIQVDTTNFHYYRRIPEIHSWQAIRTDDPAIASIATAKPYFSDQKTSATFHDVSTTRQFAHPFVHQLLSKLMTGGLDDLFDFYLNGIPVDSLNTTKVDALADAYGGDAEPARYHELKRANSLYNWEAAFHAPMLLVDRLLAAQQFDQALKMCHYLMCNSF